MGILSRTVFREICASALLGTFLFTFVLFLQRLSSLFELMVRSSASFATIGYLFALVMPYVLTFTLPVGVLVGVLIVLSRMSSDGEITAMRAAGVPGRRLIGPILLFAFAGTALAAASSLWLTPLSIRETYRLLNRMAAAQLTAEIQPRIFEEQFPLTVLYVRDVLPTEPVRWRQVFLADLTPPEERQTGARENADGPRITIASEAIAVPDLENNRIQLRLMDGSSHEAAKDGGFISSEFPRMDQLLEAKRRDEIRARAYREMDTGPLYRESRKSVDALIELHQRLALPLACVLLALVGIPIGMSSRKGGRSAAFVMTVLLAFAYWAAWIGLVGLARQGTLPVGLAVWIPNMAFGIIGLVMLIRLERPGDHDMLGATRESIISVWRRFRGRIFSASTPVRRGGRLMLLPQVIDGYILSSFLYYFLVWLASFILMTQVYVFFDLLDEIVKNKIPMARVGTYLFFLTPKLIYDSTPMSVLVATLVTFGVLSKHNEVTAMKACGVSLHRLAVPILLATAGISLGIFAFDHYYVPDANRVQDGILNEIKNRPAQTFLRPDRKWIFGKGSRIYYYTYFDPAQNVMHGVRVYELDTEPFRLKRYISAERARWEPSLETWVFQNGSTRDFDGIKITDSDNFQGEAMTFPGLDEPPGYFLQEVKQAKQMNFVELEHYMTELKQSGLDITRLAVQFHKKFSVPLFALIMAMIAVPFAFVAGGKGSMASVGVSFSIAIAYFSINQLFEQFGNLNQLPATMAAWSPDVLFGLAGMYLLFRMKT